MYTLYNVEYNSKVYNVDELHNKSLNNRRTYTKYPMHSYIWFTYPIMTVLTFVYAYPHLLTCGPFISITLITYIYTIIYTFNPIYSLLGTIIYAQYRCRYSQVWEIFCCCWSHYVVRIAFLTLGHEESSFNRVIAHYALWQYGSMCFKFGVEMILKRG